MKDRTGTVTPKGSQPLFTRKDVARILNIAPLTIRNRERRGQYDPARRDLNGYRIYNLHEVMQLQLLTFGAIDTRVIMSVLFDMGYHDPKALGQLIDEALSDRP